MSYILSICISIAILIFGRKYPFLCTMAIGTLFLLASTILLNKSVIWFGFDADIIRFSQTASHAHLLAFVATAFAGAFLLFRPAAKKIAHYLGFDEQDDDDYK
ncbi:MAG: hypothetical protein RRZ73_05625 [Oscillospiraceae bacterium]